MKSCIICGEETKQPFAAAVWHFRPLAWDDRKYVWGNMTTFGFWGGLRANVTLMFPFINTIWNWKYRKLKLVIPSEESADSNNSDLLKEE